MNRKHAYWLCQVAGWLLYAVIGIVIGVAFQSFSWRYVAAALMNVAVGFALTHLWRWWILKHGWLNLSLRELLPRIILTSVWLAIVWLGFSMIVSLLLSRLSSIPVEVRGGVALATWFNWSAALFIWALLYCGVHFFENYKQAEIQKWRLEAAVKDAELTALKSQLNPHFLFNALNSIRALIIEDPIRGQEAVTKLAGILRYSLHTGAAELATLRAEMEFVEDYLSLEMIRFDDRLTVDWRLSQEALDCAVPPMIVQTLVENGVKHGVAARRQGGTIKLRAWLENDQLRIQVGNDGRIDADPHSTKLGLLNATERLQLLFGPGAALTLTEGANDQVLADLSLPARTLKETTASQPPRPAFEMTK